MAKTLRSKQGKKPTVKKLRSSKRRPAPTQKVKVPGPWDNFVRGERGDGGSSDTTQDPPEQRLDAAEKKRLEALGEIENSLDGDAILAATKRLDEALAEKKAALEELGDGGGQDAVAPKEAERPRESMALPLSGWTDSADDADTDLAAPTVPSAASPAPSSSSKPDPAVPSSSSKPDPAVPSSSSEPAVPSSSPKPEPAAPSSSPQPPTIAAKTSDLSESVVSGLARGVPADKALVPTQGAPPPVPIQAPQGRDQTMELAPEDVLEPRSTLDSYAMEEQVAQARLSPGRVAGYAALPVVVVAVAVAVSAAIGTEGGLTAISPVFLGVLAVLMLFPFALRSIRPRSRHGILGQPRNALLLWGGLGIVSLALCIGYAHSVAWPDTSSLDHALFAVRHVTFTGGQSDLALDVGDRDARLLKKWVSMGASVAGTLGATFFVAIVIRWVLAGRRST